MHFLYINILVTRFQTSVLSYIDHHRANKQFVEAISILTEFKQ